MTAALILTAGNATLTYTPLVVTPAASVSPRGSGGGGDDSGLLAADYARRLAAAKKPQERTPYKEAIREASTEKPARKPKKRTVVESFVPLTRLSRPKSTPATKPAPLPRFEGYKPPAITQGDIDAYNARVREAQALENLAKQKAIREWWANEQRAMAERLLQELAEQQRLLDEEQDDEEAVILMAAMI